MVRYTRTEATYRKLLTLFRRAGMLPRKRGVSTQRCVGFLRLEMGTGFPGKRNSLHKSTEPRDDREVSGDHLKSTTLPE